MSTQIIAFAKETMSKKLLFQELPYHGVNIIFNNDDQVLKSLGSLYMYMRVLTVFDDARILMIPLKELNVFEHIPSKCFLPVCTNN